MKDYVTLPEGYTEISKINLMNNKKQMFIITGLSIGILAIMSALGVVLVQNVNMFDGVLQVAVMVIGYVVYIILHELVHGIFMKKYSGVKVTYGFNGGYAYAGSSAYFCKKHYIVIALAPVVVWGIVLAIINALVSTSWFWTVYIIQIGNISGAAGDFYVTYAMCKMSEDILVNDTGYAMTIYAKKL